MTFADDLSSSRSTPPGREGGTSALLDSFARSFVETPVILTKEQARAEHGPQPGDPAYEPTPHDR